MEGKTVNWMDVFIIIIIAINGLKGLSIGLVLSFFSIASFIAAGIIAKIYYPMLSQFILEKTNLISEIYGFVFQKIAVFAKDNPQIQGASEKNIYEIMNFPKTLSNFLIKSNGMKQYSEEVMNNIYGYVSEIITRMVVDLISIVIIFLIAKLILNIIGKVLDSIASLPIINQFNRLGGLLFGTLKGALIVLILFALMVPAASIFPSSFIVEGLNNSSLAKYFYDYNIILNMLGSFIDFR
ncbi:MAG: hypothetical protein PWQ37_1577 [Candidatus Petromonas sp.]|jgi:uncharacterized membrane protein required for colicin V production|nr:hypothetical protein [Candidatus Petromonas sp.]